MKRLDFRKLSWPANLHMDLLSQVLTERQLAKLINFFADRPPGERIIRLPKRQTILKALCFYYGEKVDVGKLTWDEVMEELRLKFGNLEKFGLSRKKVKYLFGQRRREIEKQR